MIVNTNYSISNPPKVRMRGPLDKIAKKKTILEKKFDNLLSKLQEKEVDGRMVIDSAALDDKDWKVYTAIKNLMSFFRKANPATSGEVENGLTKQNIKSYFKSKIRRASVSDYDFPYSPKSTILTDLDGNIDRIFFPAGNRTLIDATNKMGLTPRIKVVNGQETVVYTRKIIRGKHLCEEDFIFDPKTNSMVFKNRCIHTKLLTKSTESYNGRPAVVIREKDSDRIISVNTGARSAKEAQMHMGLERHFIPQNEDYSVPLTECRYMYSRTRKQDNKVYKDHFLWNPETKSMDAFGGWAISDGIQVVVEKPKGILSTIAGARSGSIPENEFKEMLNKLPKKDVPGYPPNTVLDLDAIKNMDDLEVYWRMFKYLEGKNGSTFVTVDTIMELFEKKIVGRNNF